jgi:hypothetical protein
MSTNGIIDRFGTCARIRELVHWWDRVQRTGQLDAQFGAQPGDGLHCAAEFPQASGLSFLSVQSV